jgi:hypothetical protein
MNGLTRRDATTMFFLSAVFASVTTILALLFSSTFPTVTLDTATKVLQNVIQLDGVLFGFTAVMFTIIHTREHTYMKEITRTVFLLTSLWCYIVSIAMSFDMLMQQLTVSLVLAPAWVAIVGAIFSSVYLIMAVQTREEGVKP